MIKLNKGVPNSCQWRGGTAAGIAGVGAGILGPLALVALGK